MEDRDHAHAHASGGKGKPGQHDPPPAEEPEGEPAAGHLSSPSPLPAGRTPEPIEDNGRVRMQLLNNVTHDLATPLTPMRFQMHLLRTGALGELTDDQAKAVDIITRNLGQMDMLVSDLRDVARVRRGGLAVEPEPVDLNGVAAAAVESFRGLAEKRHVELSFEPGADAVVRADPRRVTQVLFNLINNAIRFTGRTATEAEPGRVTVRTCRIADDGAITIHDTGPGVARHEMSQLFKPFTQLEAGRQDGQGSGLGLYICRGIIEALDGSIWCDSDGPGRGATFGFSLPTSDDPAA